MGRPLGRMVIALATLFALGGCVLPVAVTIASLALDSVSYVSTGKSVQDHAISVVADEDCALWRAVLGRPVCEETVRPIVAFLPSQPIQESARPRDGARDAVGLDGPVAGPPGVQPAETAQSGAPAEVFDQEPMPPTETAVTVAAAESIAENDSVGDAFESSMVADEDHVPLQLTQASLELPSALREAMAVDRDSAAPSAGQTQKPRPAHAAPSAIVARVAPARREGPAHRGTEEDAARILAAKAAGVGPFALASDGAWRAIDADPGRQLVAAFDAVLGSDKGAQGMARASASEARSVYLVFGTFADSSKAATATRRYAGFTARVLRDSRDGRALYRVVTGPYALSEAPGARDVAAQNGAPHVWLLRL